jgi:1-acyl-sn-glycerol-3-phosphate acyltransferase
MVPPRPVRRGILPVLLALELGLVALALVACVVGVAAALLDRRWRVLRIAAMAVAYVGVEWCALLALFGVWLAAPVRGRRWAEAANLEVLWWALDRTLAVAARTLGFRVDVTGPPDGRPLSEPAPVLVLARHGGVGDSIALVWLLLDRWGRRPRIALKDVLAWDPLADVVLGRFGASFIPPLSRRRAAAGDLLGAMARRLGPRDALLLFPEGRNWTPRRWTAAVRRLRSEHAPAHARRAALMEHVLPPRSGGVSACLDARPDLPVAVFAHTGLDKIASARELWSALPFRPPMRVRWWPSLPPPTDRSERTDWLIREWAVVDEWIDSRQAG